MRPRTARGALRPRRRCAPAQAPPLPRPRSSRSARHGRQLRRRRARPAPPPATADRLCSWVSARSKRSRISRLLSTAPPVSRNQARRARDPARASRQPGRAGRSDAASSCSRCSPCSKQPIDAGWVVGRRFRGRDPRARSPSTVSSRGSGSRCSVETVAASGIHPRPRSRDERGFTVRDDLGDASVQPTTLATGYSEQRPRRSAPLATWSPSTTSTPPRRLPRARPRLRAR